LARPVRQLMKERTPGARTLDAPEGRIPCSAMAYNKCISYKFDKFAGRGDSRAVDALKLLLLEDVHPSDRGEA